jgi:hypothetical protein
LLTASPDGVPLALSHVVHRRVMLHSTSCCPDEFLSEPLSLAFSPVMSIPSQQLQENFPVPISSIF